MPQVHFKTRLTTHAQRQGNIRMWQASWLDQLGCDHLFIDEAHYFKNLETPTKMDRVAGIQTGGSECAFDMYMEARYLDEQHSGHGVTFAMGTPISNSMVELFTVQKFLDPEGPGLSTLKALPRGATESRA